MSLRKKFDLAKSNYLQELLGGSRASQMRFLDGEGIQSDFLVKEVRPTGRAKKLVFIGSVIEGLGLHSALRFVGQKDLSTVCAGHRAVSSINHSEHFELQQICV